MRRTDILDNPDHEKTPEDLFDILSEVYQRGNIDFSHGKDPYDRTQEMIVVGSWEDLAQLNVIINGWEGGQVANLWNKEDLNKEINKAETELEKTKIENPNHLGTISRLETRIKQLINLSAYKRWLHNNDYEEFCIEDFGIEFGFSDEYSNCCSCYNNIVRTSPDSYSWSPPLFVDCEGYACEECVDSGEYDEYILEEYKNEQKGVPQDFDLNRLGLVKVNDRSYENGFHRGQDDSPEPIIEAFNSVDIDVWFSVHSSQFYIYFDVLVKEEDEEKAKILLNTVDTYQGFSTSGNMERALKEASRKMSELPDGEGIKYSKCNSDGTAEVRLVSREEFINGIKE